MKWRGPIGGGAASGKAGSMVASRAKSTQYLRARVTPVNPRSTFQQAVRNGVKALTSLWQSLSHAQKSGWNVYAANVSVVNALGDSAKLSGFNWFVGNNAIRKQINISPTLNAPTVFDVGNPDWNLVEPTGTIATNGTLGTLTLASAIAGNNGTNGFLALFVSRPYSGGRAYFNGPYQFSHAFVANSSGNIPAASYTFQSPFTASGVSTNDSTNLMSFVLRLDRGDGRLSSKFQGALAGS